MIIFGLRITYDGQRAQAIVNADSDKVINELYKDIAVLRLVPPRKRAILRPKDVENALDMFWETTQRSVSVKRIHDHGISSMNSCFHYLYIIDGLYADAACYNVAGYEPGADNGEMHVRTLEYLL
jgi:hypothetical protein